MPAEAREGEGGLIRTIVRPSSGALPTTKVVFRRTFQGYVKVPILSTLFLRACAVGPTVRSEWEGASVLRTKKSALRISPGANCPLLPARVVSCVLPGRQLEPAGHAQSGANYTDGWRPCQPPPLIRPAQSEQGVSSGGTRNRLPVQRGRASREVKIRAEWGPSTTLHLNSVQPVENPSRRAWSLSTAAHTAGQPTRHPDPNGTRRYGSSPAVWTRWSRSRIARAACLP